MQGALPQKKATVVPRLHLPAIAALSAGGSLAMPPTAACTITAVPRAPSARTSSLSQAPDPTARAEMPPPLAAPGFMDGDGVEAAEWTLSLGTRGLGSAASVASATPSDVSELGAKRMGEQLTPGHRAALAAAAEQARLGPAGNEVIVLARLLRIECEKHTFAWCC